MCASHSSVCKLQLLRETLEGGEEHLDAGIVQQLLVQKSLYDAPTIMISASAKLCPKAPSLSRISCLAAEVGPDAPLTRSAAVSSAAVPLVKAVYNGMVLVMVPDW